jgi:hypothetical protein
LSVVILTATGFSFAFVLIRVSVIGYFRSKEAEKAPETLPQSETPVKTRKPRSKKQS